MTLKTILDKAQPWLCVLVVFLLQWNFLLYSFFDQLQYKNLIRIGVLLLLALMLFIQLYKKQLKRLHLVFLCAAPIILAIQSSLAFNFLFLILIVVAFSSVEKKFFYKATFSVVAFLSLVVVFSLIFKIQIPWIYTDPDTLRTRNTLGFINVNSASIFFFSLIVSYLFMRKKVTYWDLGIVTGSAVVLYIITDSRTPLLGVLVLSILYALLPHLPKKFSAACLRIGILILFLTAFIWKLPFVNSSLGNAVLSERPRIFVSFIQEQKILSFFFGGSVSAEIDNLYLLLLYNLGIFFYLAIGYVVLRIATRMLYRRQYLETAFLVSMLFCGIFEGTLLRPEIFSTPLFWFVCFRDFLNRSKPSELVGKVNQFLLKFLPS